MSIKTYQNLTFVLVVILLLFASYFAGQYHNLLLNVYAQELLGEENQAVSALEAESQTRSNNDQPAPEREAPVPGGPGFISIHPSAFTPKRDYIDYAYSIGNAYWLWNPSTTTDGAYVAPLLLPNGATITKFVLFYYDTDPGEDVRALLRRSPLTGVGSYEEMAYAISMDSSGFGYYETTQINHQVIDLQEYSYVIEVYLRKGYSTNIGLTGIRIDFEYPSYLPLIEN